MDVFLSHVFLTKRRSHSGKKPLNPERAKSEQLAAPQVPGGLRIKLYSVSLQHIFQDKGGVSVDKN
jgi:hypothetical protein